MRGVSVNKPFEQWRVSDIIRYCTHHPRFGTCADCQIRENCGRWFDQFSLPEDKEKNRPLEGQLSFEEFFA